MSKASEYAERVKAAKARPSYRGPVLRPYPPVAEVSDDGQLVLNLNTIGPHDALELAAWIQETFGEQADKPREWWLWYDDSLCGSGWKVVEEGSNLRNRVRVVEVQP